MPFPQGQMLSRCGRGRGPAWAGPLEGRGSDRPALQFIHTLENQREFSARAKVYFASLLTVALHGKLEYYTDIMRTLFLELMEQYVVAKNPKLMLRRSVCPPAATGRGGRGQQEARPESGPPGVGSAR